MLNPITYGQKHGCKDTNTTSAKVLKVMERAARPLTAEDIVPLLRKEGILADKRFVSDAMGRLKQGGKAVAVKVISGKKPHWFLYTWMKGGKPKPEYLEKLSPINKP